VKIQLRLFAGLRERAGTERLELEGLPEGLDVGCLKLELAQRHPELGDLSAVRGVLGTSYVLDDTKLEDGAEVSLIPPVSGGANSEHEALLLGVFEIHSEALDVEAARLCVGHDSCGAQLVFTGVTRDRNRDLDVTGLDYEAFDEMAGAEMGLIFSDCNQRFGPASLCQEGAERNLRMLVLHRTGEVLVGQPSVVVAVASPHRDAAFLAARFLIDELKARVPLWKKECYRDGHHWIGERS
jgi:molybdopterin synthase catalytic subunit/molybdopterin converting factor small subunit